MKSLLRSSILLICAFAMLLLTACGGTAQPATTPQGSAKPAATASGAPVTIRWASSVAKSEIEANNTPGAIAINTWIKTVESASNGSIKVQIFPGSQLANGTDETISGLQNGAFEMAQLNTGSWGDYTQAFAALNVPYLFTDYSLVHAVMDSDFGKQMLQKVQNDVGVIPLCYSDIGYRHVTSSKGFIKSPADFKGVKIRTMTDPIQISSFNDLGAAVTPLSISELFSALQQKLVDAQENPLSTIFSNKFYEVQKYCTLTRHSYTTTLFFMNKDFYNKLSDSQKAAIKAANEAATKASRQRLEAAEKEYQDKLTAAGMQFYKPTDAEMTAFQNAVKPTWDKVKKTMGDDQWNKLIATVNSVKKS